jgi:hypothetical protein
MKKLKDMKNQDINWELNWGITWGVNTICLGKVYMHHHFAIKSQKSVMGKVIKITYLNCMMN